MNVKTGFPKNPSLATTLPRGAWGLPGRGREEVCGRLKLRKGAIVLPVEGAAGSTCPPHLPLPLGRGSGEAHGCPLALKR